MGLSTGIGASGLWSVSRGLTRGLESRHDYKTKMGYADTPRRLGWPWKLILKSVDRVLTLVFRSVPGSGEFHDRAIRIRPLRACPKISATSCSQ